MCIYNKYNSQPSSFSFGIKYQAIYNCIIKYGVFKEIGGSQHTNDPHGSLLFPHHTVGVLALWHTSKNVVCVTHLLLNALWSVCV